MISIDISFNTILVYRTRFCILCRSIYLRFIPSSVLLWLVKTGSANPSPGWKLSGTPQKLWVWGKSHFLPSFVSPHWRLSLKVGVRHFIFNHPHMKPFIKHKQRTGFVFELVVFDWTSLTAIYKHFQSMTGMIELASWKVLKVLNLIYRKARRVVLAWKIKKCKF